jgi:hypothetical protein
MHRCMTQTGSKILNPASGMQDDLYFILSREKKASKNMNFKS